MSELEPTNKWFPSRDIHKEFSDSSWAPVFEYSHIVEGMPIDADIEIKCRRCTRLLINLSLAICRFYFIVAEKTVKMLRGMQDG